MFVPLRTSVPAPCFFSPPSLVVPESSGTWIVLLNELVSMIAPPASTFTVEVEPVKPMKLPFVDFARSVPPLRFSTDVAPVLKRLSTATTPPLRFSVEVPEFCPS